ncbi:MAG: hypothetical protein HN563_02645, partial [Flavobacteriales bacterium]|nr:hypothetical protein [Flavobacteriales bacterium]
MRYLVAVIVCMISVSVFGQADIFGCTTSIACNYNPDATIDDGSCDYCSCDIIASDAYSLTIESSAAVAADGTTYRFYVNMTDSTDRLSSVFGHNNSHLIINTPEGAFNSPNNLSWNASGINPAFLSTFPDMADDTYATIGLDGPASTSGIAGAADPSIVEDPAQPITPYFLTDGATSLSSTTLIGSSWYVLNTAGNGLPNNDMRVLVLQVTTTGSISGTINYQVFPLGVGAEQVQITTEFDGVGVFNSSHTEYGCGCTDASACNYAVEAIYDDGSCTYINITEGECDCAGNVLDECGVCNGSGAVYECGCFDIPEDDCDCDGNVLDECGECNGDNESCSGCCITFAMNYDPQALVCDITICEYQPTCASGDACNYDPTATFDDGTVCVYPDECGGCDGEETGPGIPEGDCDCDGNVLDECGVCGGSGIAEGYCDCAGNVLDECGVCAGYGIPDGDCDCDGNVLDPCGVCGGDGVDEDCDGICDSID